MKVLTLEEWRKLFGKHYKCLKSTGTIKQPCQCKNCRQARTDYEAAVAPDQKLIAEYERTKK